MKVSGLKLLSLGYFSELCQEEEVAAIAHSLNVKRLIYRPVPIYQRLKARLSGNCLSWQISHNFEYLHHN